MPKKFSNNFQQLASNKDEIELQATYNNPPAQPKSTEERFELGVE